MTRRRRWGRGTTASPLVLGGVGLIALVVAASLLWSESQAVAGTALAIAVLFGVRVGWEVAALRRGEPALDRRVGVAPLALLSGLGFLLLALLR